MGGSRAQSQVIGAIFIFGFIVAALASAQVFLVPQNNEEVEFTHNQQAQRSMHDLRQSIQQSAVVGVSQSASIDLGPNYPTRFLLLNPPKPAGTIRTAGGDAADLRIRNAVALSDEVEDFWNGSRTVSGPGKRIVYDPSYNLYENAPKTVYENSVLYNNFSTSGEYIVRTDQDVVDGRQIYLLAVGGNKSLSTAETETLDVKSVSPATQTIAIQNTSGGPVNVTIPTKLPEKVWVQQLLAEEIDDPSSTSCDGGGFGSNNDDGRYIVDCTYVESTSGPNKIHLEFQETENGNDVTYSLRMGKVGVGTGIKNPEAQYITDLQGDGADVSLNGRQSVVFQVRDKYNSPVSDIEVDVRVDDDDDGRLLYQGNYISNESNDNIPVGPNGKVELTYVAPGGSSTSPLNVSVDAKFGSGSFDDGNATDASVSMQVINASRIDRTQPLLNPNNLLIVEDAEITGDNCAGQGNVECEVNIIFNATSSDVDIEKMRYVFYSADEQGFSGAQSQAFPEYTPTDREFPIAGDFQNISGGSLEVNGTETITVQFYSDENEPREVKTSDFFVISLIVEGERQTYFISQQMDN